ncbi:hypothetical protein BvMPK_1339 [Phocaeicola vulgatus]|uniref:Uncharacterized protein n=1 Tax=Phocaeicola vulgatus TaxID=821 RepID=A0A0N7J720_PHOVU|nr:hypothetical protein BvMPK_1339 [Phocaeicola vulgatus]
MSEMLKGNKTALPEHRELGVRYCQGTGGLRSEGLPDRQTDSFGCRSGNMIMIKDRRKEKYKDEKKYIEKID